MTEAAGGHDPTLGGDVLTTAFEALNPDATEDDVEGHLERWRERFWVEA